MKKLPTKIASLSLVSLALCLGATAQEPSAAENKAAQNPVPPPSTASTPSTSSISSTEQKPTAPAAAATAPALQQAPDDAKDRTDKKLAGRHVRGKDGKDLGTVKDFLINPQSGEVVFGVVSSGGVGSVGDKLRLVPFKALHPGSGTKSDEFSIMLDKTQWEQGVVVNEDELKDGRFTLADDQRRTYSERFGEATAGTGTASNYYTAGMSAHLIRASELRGKDVRSGTQEIGSIEGIVIQRDGMNSMALFDPKSGRTGARGKFLVPLNQFTMGSGKREPISTQLTMASFEPASSASTTTAVASTTDQRKSSQSTTQIAGHKSEGSATVAASTSTPQKNEAGAATAATAQQAGSVAGATAESSIAASSPRSSSAREATAETQQGSLAAADRASVSTQATPNAETSPSPTGRTGIEHKVAVNESKSAASTGQAGIEHKVAVNESPVAATTEPKGSATGEKSEVDRERSGSIAANENSPAKPAAGAQAQDQRTQINEQIAATSIARSSPDENLTPTGQTSADQNPKNADPTLLSSARAIRKSLDADDSLARLDVVVTPGPGKILLRGKVANEQLKSSIEQKAKAAAAGAAIDNQITVETR